MQNLFTLVFKDTLHVTIFRKHYCSMVKNVKNGKLMIYFALYCSTSYMFQKTMEFTHLNTIRVSFELKISSINQWPQTVPALVLSYLDALVMQHMHLII